MKYEIAVKTQCFASLQYNVDSDFRPPTSAFIPKSEILHKFHIHHFHVLIH